MYDDVQDQIYLGDGVYAHHDGYQIWLTTQEGMEIALEPEVLCALDQYRTMLVNRANAAAAKSGA